MIPNPGPSALKSQTPTAAMSLTKMMIRPNMQMARRPEQSTRPSQSTSGALTRRPTEQNRSAERVESWRGEKRSDDLSGALS